MRARSAAGRRSTSCTFGRAARYSEDIDLVQIDAGPIGPVLAEVHAALDTWLGAARWKQSEGRVTLTYRFESEDVPPVPMKLKVEINSREHFTVSGTGTFGSKSRRAGSPAAPTFARTHRSCFAARSDQPPPRGGDHGRGSAPPPPGRGRTSTRSSCA